ncbi:hypothetical protein B0O99DRAFT_191556 [Bisporella sp. PMI_857]|nr:hypothetical protein B0O99DRAFT_191556 [Bisporella sp. PMI_857]
MEAWQQTSVGYGAATTPTIQNDSVGNSSLLPHAELGVTPNTTENPQPDWLQQMYDIEPLEWRGGENYHDGLHDGFCFVCGDTLELFGCETCAACYHANCMTPSLAHDAVPKFWFCPHCVEKQWHIPPEMNYLTPSSPQQQKQSVPETIPTEGANEINMMDHAPRETLDSDTQRIVLGLNTVSAKSSGHIDRVSSSSLTKKSLPQRNDGPRPGKAMYAHTKRSSSPLRKKSKYSTLSAEVEKALSVIHSQLEAAALNSKADDSLLAKTKDLEQQLRIQEGQIKLASNDSSNQRLKNERLQTENANLKAEVDRLTESLQRKEAELKDWRAKLRTMMDDGVE